MSAEPDVKKAVEWYREKRGIFDALAKRVESIIREVLDEQNINYYSISSRAKSIASYEAKASKEKYSNPLSEIQDMAEVRVITYTNADARRVTQIIQGLFEIQPEHTIDKTEELGIDRAGYRSIHCVGTLGKERVKLPENKAFEKMCFEIQVRTILQHAWAEFEHDRNYKFSGVLPKGIRRRLSMVAANLELMDGEFDRISEQIDTYIAEVDRKTESGDLQVSIDSKSLSSYMTKKFSRLIELGMSPTSSYNEEIRFLSHMGINTLKEVDDIVPEDYIDKRAKHLRKGDYIAGIIFDLLVIKDVDDYFESWKKILSVGLALHSENILFLKEYGIDIETCAKKHGVSFYSFQKPIDA